MLALERPRASGQALEGWFLFNQIFTLFKLAQLYELTQPPK